MFKEGTTEKKQGAKLWIQFLPLLENIDKKYQKNIYQNVKSYVWVMKHG